MSFARTERTGLCDLLLELGPDAPTLCAGWTTHHLAAHLWLRETDPLAALGILIAPLAGLTEKRMSTLRQRRPYPELVARLRRGPASLSPFALPGVDEAANGIEFFIHHEDVRRAGPAPAAPRDLPDRIEARIWKQLTIAARAYYRSTATGIVLEWTEPDGGRPVVPPIRARRGERTVTIQGRPSELLLHASGRTRAAQIHLIGEPATLALLGEDAD